MQKDSIEKARLLIRAVGPNGCKGIACKAYCADTSHEDACFSTAIKFGLVRAEVVSVVQDIKQNGGPGGCTTPTSCRDYCADTTHTDECKAFAASHNLKPIPQIIKKAEERMASTTEAKTAAINAILAKTAGPGGCTTADACRTYCADKTHQAECAAFAQANGLTGDGQPARMGTSTKPMIPAGIKQKIEARVASSTSGKPGVRAILQGRPLPVPKGVTPTNTSVTGSAETDTSAGGEPATTNTEDTAAPAGGAGVLWGFLHFFTGRR